MIRQCSAQPRLVRVEKPPRISANRPPYDWDSVDRSYRLSGSVVFTSGEIHMMQQDHNQLLIAVARRGRWTITTVAHLARRAGLDVGYWQQIARDLSDLGYAETYDDGQSLNITEDGWAEAQRLLAAQRLAGQNPAPPSKPTPAASPSPNRSCQRCSHPRRPSGRFCAHCGLRYAD